MYQRIILFFAVVLLGTAGLNAQKERKVSFVGGALSTLNNNTLIVRDSLPDSTTAKRNSGGYALIDLGVNIKPNKHTEIMGMFRIKNNFGGFWGSGVSFDVRQLWVKGVVANAVRYQIGDINLKQTPFTLFNHHADQIDSLPSIFSLQRNIVNDEKFYLDNHSWRMQGANVDFGFTFSKYVKEANFNAFITRLNATNFSTIPDRLMGGISIQLIQSNKFSMSYNGNSVFDVKGTIIDSNVFKNVIHTVDWKYITAVGKNTLSFNGEYGTSKYLYTADTLAPKLNDYFINIFTQLSVSKLNLKATLGYLNVGPDFRSIGSQSKDVNYNAPPVYFNRYTNSQQIRPITLFDIISNENIYNHTISSALASENPAFNYVLPYGMATFNRVGAYAKLQYLSKKLLAVHAEYFNLSEIRGQGSKEYKHFSIVKVFSNIPINSFFHYKKTIAFQLGVNSQSSKRTSNEVIEKVDLKMMHLNAGLRWELFTNFELLAGFISQSTRGYDFSADRNSYGEVTYFNLNHYDLNQEIKALGIRYNFSEKAYLCALYQQSSYQDKLKKNADFTMNQFGIIYNITL
ncbi:MAG: hypothetical protein NTW54_07550 [Bacteroidetes bacterium]|nr:hypothetical protein [Bacteroidota bacterium]